MKQVLPNEFVALLSDFGDPDDPTRLEAVFARDEILDGDAHLIAPGATFMWTIGRETSRFGQIKNVDFIRFHRLPAWTQREVEEAHRRARELEAEFDSGEP